MSWYPVPRLFWNCNLPTQLLSKGTGWASVNIYDRGCFNPAKLVPILHLRTGRRQWPGHQDLSSCHMNLLMCWLERQKLSPNLHHLHLTSCWLVVLLAAHLVVLRCLGGLICFPTHVPVHRDNLQNDGISNMRFENRAKHTTIPCNRNPFLTITRSDDFGEPTYETAKVPPVIVINKNTSTHNKQYYYWG